MARSAVRTQVDLDRVGRALGEHFKTDLVVVVGSQSVLVGWPEAPVLMRTSDEIDAYPANFKEWEALSANDGFVASEEIAAIFGILSTFSETHGFYIDGVDNTTAILHSEWSKRAVFRDVECYGSIVTIIAPSVEDMAVSKLIRLFEKDRTWLAACHEKRPFNKENLIKLVSETVGRKEIVDKVTSFLDTLPDNKPYRTPTVDEMPNYDSETHCITISGIEGTLFVRAWDERYGLYNKVDNHLGPAVISRKSSLYFLNGKEYSYENWFSHPRVVEARGNNTNNEKSADFTPPKFI